MHTKIISILSFFIIWLGLNGMKFDVVSIFFLFLAPISMFYLATRLLLISEKTNFNFFKAGKYFLWLIREIIISSIAVSKIAWRKNIVVHPSIEPVISIQTKKIGIVVYANSITLTPGTVTLSTEDNKLLVHALDIKFMEDLQEGTMDRNIKAIIKASSNDIL